jgi:GT2 family glycosyltransferase
MTISVIIVNWNAKAFLRKCLESLRHSACPFVVEILVVDNSSADGSSKMIQMEFPEVRLIQSSENLGFARANNLALKQAKGTYLALVNSDVVVHDGCLEYLVTVLERSCSVALAGPKVYGVDGEIQHTCHRFPTVWNVICRFMAIDRILGRWPIFSGFEMRHWNYSCGGEVEVLSGCFWLGRKSAIDAVGGFDERFFFYAEDVDCCKRIVARGWKVVYVPEATATHFGGGSSSNAPLRYSIEILRANLAYWKKHRGYIGQYTYYSLCILHYTVKAFIRTFLNLIPFRSPKIVGANLDEDYTCLRWLLTGKRSNR